MPSGNDPRMASYELNDRAVAHARDLISKRQYVLESEWGEVQPTADDENAFLEAHTWDEYAAWHLGLTDGANDHTKARYAFVSSVAPSVSPRCQAAYSSHECDLRKAFSSSAAG